MKIFFKLAKFSLGSAAKRNKCDSPRMLSHNLSIYLDLLRLIASMVVFINHSRNFILPALPTALAHGREAVAMFFVLSGFVICFVVSEREKSWRAYLVARVARIYPVAVVTIVLTIILDSIGTYINPSHYDILNRKFHFYHPIDLWSAIRYLTFSNQLWFEHVIFGTDEPYWSLGFEVWYYILFGVAVFIVSPAKTIIIAILAIICGPKILLFFPLWFLGVLGYKIIASEVTLPKSGAILLFCLSIITVAIIIRSFGARVTDMYHTYGPMQESINFIYFTLIGLAITTNLIAFDSMSKGVRVWPLNVGLAIRWAAGSSFTLYLAHQPIEVFLSAFVGVKPSLFQGLVCMILTIIIVLSVAELGERRKAKCSALIRKFVFPE